MDIAVFKEIGFTEREVKVYSALVELGESTAGPIAAKSRLAHTKVYETLERLKDKGLVTFVLISKTKHYQAVSPSEILKMLDERKKRVIEAVEELALKAKFAKQKQFTAVHEGHKALRALFNNIVAGLNKGDYYYAFALKADYHDANAPIFFSNIHRKLADKHVIDKAIAHEDIRAEISKTYQTNKNIQLRFLKRSVPVGVVILHGRVIQLIWGELPTAIEINSDQMSRQYKSFFEELWAESKK